MVGCTATPFLQPSLIPIEKDNVDEVIRSLQDRLDEDNEDVLAHYNLALAYFEKGEYVQAETHIQRAVQLSPLIGEYFELLGDIARQTERYSAAAKAFNSAVRLQPNLISAYLKLAIVYEQIGDNERAIASLEEALQREPSSVETLFQLARLNTKQRDFEAASEAVNAALALEAQNQELLLLQVHIQSAQGNYYHARVLVQRLLTQYPDYYEAQHELLKILFAQKKWDQALDQISLLRKNNQLRLSDQLIHVHILLRQKEFEKARIVLTSILEAAPLQVDAMLALALVFVQQGEPDQALTWLNRSLEVNTRLPQVHYLQASLYYKKGNLLQGDLSLNRALELDGNNPSYRLLELRRNLMKGEVNAVQERLNQLLPQNPLDPELLRLQADLYAFQGRYNLAINLIRRLQVIEDSDILRFTLARLYYFQQQYHKTLAITREVVQIYPHDWETSYLHASTLFRLNQIPEAFELLQPFLEANQGDGFIHLLIGNFYRYQGKEEEARKVFQEGLEAFPQHLFLTEALSAAYMLTQDWRPARDVILEVIEQAHPLQPILLQRLVYLYYQLGDSERSAEYLKRFYHQVDPIITFNNPQQEYLLLFPIASPVLGHIEYTTPLIPE